MTRLVSESRCFRDFYQRWLYTRKFLLPRVVPDTEGFLSLGGREEFLVSPSLRSRALAGAVTVALVGTGAVFDIGILEGLVADVMFRSGAQLGLGAGEERTAGAAEETAVGAAPRAVLGAVVLVVTEAAFAGTVLRVVEAAPGAEVAEAGAFATTVEGAGKGAIPVINSFEIGPRMVLEAAATGAPAEATELREGLVVEEAFLCLPFSGDGPRTELKGEDHSSKNEERRRLCPPMILPEVGLFAVVAAGLLVVAEIVVSGLAAEIGLIGILLAAPVVRRVAAYAPLKVSVETAAPVPLPFGFFAPRCILGGDPLTKPSYLLLLRVSLLTLDRSLSGSGWEWRGLSLRGCV